MNRLRLHRAFFSSFSIAFTAAAVFTPAIVAAAGIVPDGSRIFMSVNGNENICGPADENHNSFCATAAGPTVPVSIPLTTFTDPRGANFGFITASASVTSGKTATGTTNSNSGPFEFIGINDTYTVHGTASGSFPITVTLHITGSFGTRETGPPFGNILTFEASRVKIGTFHPESTLTQFVVDPFPADAQNPTSPNVGQTHSTVVSPTPQTFPLDVQASYTKIVNINDVFDIGYSIELNLSGNGQINMIPTTDVISFALPEGVFLTSALGATFGTPSGVVGDYNADNVVDAADYTVWRDNLGSTTILPNDPSPGMVTLDDYDTWKTHFGEIAGSGSGESADFAVPEPATLLLLTFAAASGCLWRDSTQGMASKTLRGRNS